MRVLIACECSGVVREAFRARGHDAWSCDFAPAQDGSEFHIQGDALKSLRGWDLMIAHPPCTHLSVSGACRFAAKRADGRQQAAIDFFLALVRADIPKICIENPVGIMSTAYRKPDQYVQPYDFGDDASKKTGLWLKGLPVLVKDPARYVKPRLVDGRPRWANQCDSGQNKLGPSPTRAQERSRTYSGIARAMAEQWG
jgi:site-specific DNA-cytosine methylase